MRACLATPAPQSPVALSLLEDGLHLSVRTAPLVTSLSPLYSVRYDVETKQRYDEQWACVEEPVESHGQQVCALNPPQALQT